MEFHFALHNPEGYRKYKQQTENMVETTKYDENMDQEEFDRVAEMLTAQRQNIEWEEIPISQDYSPLNMARPVSLGPIKKISG